MSPRYPSTSRRWACATRFGVVAICTSVIAWNAHQIQRYELGYSCATVEFEGHVAATDRTDGAGVKDKVFATREMFGSIVVRFEDQIAEGDRVASRITIDGTDTSGAAISAKLIAISQLTEGKIVAEWGIADTGSR